MLPNRLIISVFNIRVTAKLTALSCSPSRPLSLSLPFEWCFYFFMSPPLAAFPPLTPHLPLSCLALLPYWLLFTFCWTFWSCPTMAATTSTAMLAATLAVSAEFSNELLLDCSLSLFRSFSPFLSLSHTQVLIKLNLSTTLSNYIATR